MSDYDDILSAAEQLPVAERLRLIDELAATVSPEDFVSPGEAWIQEVKGRSEAYDKGEMTASSWSDVQRRARNKAGLDE